MSNRAIRRASSRLTVLLVLLSAASCVADCTVEKNTAAIEASTTTIRANTDSVAQATRSSVGAIEDNTVEVKRSRRDLAESLEATEHVGELLEANTKAIGNSATAIDNNSRLVEATSAALKANKESVDAVADSLKTLNDKLKDVEFEEVLNELRFSLILAFLAYAFVVTTMANDSRAKSEDLWLERHHHPVDPPDSTGPPARLALEQNATDFMSAYRWFLRVAVLILGFLLYSLAHCEGGGWYWLYAAGVFIASAVLARYYVIESEQLRKATGRRLRVPSLCLLLFWIDPAVLLDPDDPLGPPRTAPGPGGLSPLGVPAPSSPPATTEPVAQSGPAADATPEAAAVRESPQPASKTGANSDPSNLPP